MKFMFSILVVVVFGVYEILTSPLVSTCTSLGFFIVDVSAGQSCLTLVKRDSSNFEY